MRKQIEIIQAEMKKRGLDAFLITTQDYHNSEYVNDFFKFRAWATGFTGTDSSAVILQDRAALWVDGRYYIQGEQQLAGSGIEMVKLSELNAITIEGFLKENLPEGGNIGVDARTIDMAFGARLASVAKAKGGQLIDIDLTPYTWELDGTRPALDPKPVYMLEAKYNGRPTTEKLAAIRAKLAESGVTAFVLSSLTEIAWTLNLRGDDIAYCPVFFSYLVIDEAHAYLYAYRSAFNAEICKYLEDCGVELRDYELFFEELNGLVKGQRVLVDSREVSYALVSRLDRGNLLKAANPTTLMASIKNETEIANLRKANLADGAALVRTIKWLKEAVAAGESVYEMDLVNYALKMRLEEGALGAGFETIAGYGSNGAIVHYETSDECSVKIEPKGFMLLDSGGHYLNGTTDITRTIAVGPLTEEEKEHYTLVLQGMIDLSMAVYAEGANGANLDTYARMPLWRKGLDFKHGTGHGVGYLLNVHEGPQNIRKTGTAPLVPGMVTTNEPGIYIEGKHGVRIENNLLTRFAFESEYGNFYDFETLTLCTLEPEAIVTEMLTEAQLKWVNDYHKMVYEKLSPRLSEDVRAWLSEETKPITR